MRLVSPFTLCLVVVLWSLLFLLSARYFLFNAHQVSEFVLWSWYTGTHLHGSVSQPAGDAVPPVLGRECLTVDLRHSGTVVVRTCTALYLGPLRLVLAR